MRLSTRIGVAEVSVLVRYDAQSLFDPFLTFRDKTTASFSRF
jgi:hypothetical protein